jgi:two-component sensor histidine kinase
MFKKIFFVVVFLFSFLSEGYTQTYPLINLTTKDGLPSNTVYSVSRDRKGYLWIATDKGIARYNGREMELFTTFNGLPDNEIFGFKEDWEDRLWIFGFNGNLCFFKDGIFHTAKNTPWLKLKKNTTASGHLETDSSLTLVVMGGRYFINIKHDKVNYFDLSDVRTKNKILGNDISTVRKLNERHYEIFIKEKSLIIDTSGNTISSKHYKQSREYKSVAAQDEAYLRTSHGIFTLDEEPVYDIKSIPFSSNIFFYQDKENIFLGTRNGLIINKFKKILDNIFTTCITNNKNHWISTWNIGIYILSRNFDKMQEWRQTYQGKIVTARTINNSLYFITNYGDLHRLEHDKSKILFEHPANEKSDPLTVQHFLYPNSDYIGLSYNKNYIVTAYKGRYKKKEIFGGFWKIEQEETKEILFNNKYTYIFTIGGIIRIDLASIKEEKTKNGKFLVRSYGINSRIFSRAINIKDGTIWFSRSDGLYKISDTTIEQQHQYNGFTFRKLSIYNQYLLGLTDNNKIIVGNVNQKGRFIDSIILENCIWENIYSIDDHRAIISTNNYYRLLSLYPPSKNGKPNYTLQTIEDPFVPTQAEYITADSTNCYFFKEGTITRIATSVLFEKTAPPIPVFSSFKALDKSYLIRPEIKVSYNQSKSINITFDNISFVGKDITCQYSITDNGKDEWREITGNEINLNTPGYGTYLVKVRSKTLSSEYSKPAVIRLIVQKPFWATWWFISLCALALIMLVWGIIVFITWRKLRKKQKEHDADMKYQQSEYKALNALMNPHFIFNSLNNIQGLINKDEKRIANEYLVIFSDLVRQNMHNISKGFISLQQELTLIENYLTLEKLRFKELVNYEINVDEEVDVDDIMIPPLMIQPLVENAVKHGLLPKQSTSSKVSVQVFEKDNLLYIVIEDNGVGLTQSLQSENKLHESFGLSNLQKRTEHLKKIQQHEINIEVTELKNSDGTVKGTQAMVTIKLEN